MEEFQGKTDIESLQLAAQADQLTPEARAALSAELTRRGLGDSLQLDRFRRQEKKSETRAAQLYQKGCDGGNAGACQNLGLMYEHGEGGLRKDRAKAREYFDKAHRLGE